MLGGSLFNLKALGHIFNKKMPKLMNQTKHEMPSLTEEEGSGMCVAGMPMESKKIHKFVHRMTPMKKYL